MGQTDMSKERYELIEDAAALIFPFYADAHLLNAVKETLVLYSDDLIARLVQCFRSNDGHVDVIKTSVKKKYPEETVREHLEFFPLLPDYTHRFRENMIDSLRGYPQLPKTTDLTSMGCEVIQQCNALIRAALTIEDDTAFRHGFCTGGIMNQELVNLILQHAEAPDRLLSVISDRKTSDPALISAILNSETPAISEGLL